MAQRINLTEQSRKGTRGESRKQASKVVRVIVRERMEWMDLDRLLAQSLDQE